MRVEELRLERVTIGRARRTLRGLDTLKASIVELGLLNPITVTTQGVLIAGYHRLEACRALGWDTIPATVLDLDDVDAQLAEIDENLARNELNPLERAEEVGKRNELYVAKHGEPKHGGDRKSEEAKSSSHDENLIPKRFDLDMQEKTGVSAQVIYRDLQIVKNLPLEIRDTIRHSPLANSQSELLNLTRLEPERQAKVAAKVVSGEAKTVTEAKRQLNREEAVPPPPVVGKYRVLYADPPWQYNDTRSGGNMDDWSPAERHYPTLSLQELCDLVVDETQERRVRDIAEDNAVLFLWVTSPLLPCAFDVLAAWGFTYKASLVWDKNRPVWGNYVSVQHEYLLIATRGSCLPDNPTHFDSVVMEKSVRHSEKPETFRDMIDTLYPHGNRIELFARSVNEGWDAWGNQQSFDATH